MIQVFNIGHDGKIPARYQHLTGVPFSFMQKIKMNGVGSPSLIYEKGISEFDLVEGASRDTSNINIELFSKALVLRFKKKNHYRIAIISRDKIHEIAFTTLLFEYYTAGQKIIKKGARILIKSINSDEIELLLSIPKYEAGFSFFNKDYFSGKVMFEIEPLKPAEDRWNALIFNVLLGGMPRQ